MTLPCNRCTHFDVCRFVMDADALLDKAILENEKQPNSPLALVLKCTRYDDAKVVMRKS